MSVTGKSTKSLRKLEVSQSRMLNVGFVNTRALHQATAGQTLIQLASLTVPTGVVNYSAPSPSLLTSTNILLYQNNVSIISSISGKLIMNLSYVISGASTIKLLYAAREAEVFEILIDQNPRTATNLVDAQPLVSTGTLLATTQDYNVGTPYAVGKYLTAQHGSVLVYLDNQLVYRNTGNNPPGAGVTGDYYEVLAGAGLGTLIRFNTADPINNRNVSVVSIGSLVERPSGSQMAVMESLQGQIDALVPTLADLAGVPTTNFQATPNNTDLKAFGDRVFAIEAVDTTQNTRLVALEAGPSITIITSTTPGTYTVPAGAKWLRIRASGGGGGGGGSSSTGGAGGGGTGTGFGSLLTALGGGGGPGGISGGATGPAGGGFSVTAPAIMVVGQTGSSGGGANNAANSGGSFGYTQGGFGGANPFAGAGANGAAAAAGLNAIVNTGAGGGGAGWTTASGSSGCGGGSGGYVEVIVPGPLAGSYSYSVGPGGTGGSAGTGSVGGNGADGKIIIEVYF